MNKLINAPQGPIVFQGLIKKQTEDGTVLTSSGTVNNAFQIQVTLKDTTKVDKISLIEACDLYPSLDPTLSFQIDPDIRLDTLFIKPVGSLKVDENFGYFISLANSYDSSFAMAEIVDNDYSNITMSTVFGTRGNDTRSNDVIFLETKRQRPWFKCSTLTLPGNIFKGIDPLVLDNVTVHLELEISVVLNTGELNAQVRSMSPIKVNGILIEELPVDLKELASSLVFQVTSFTLKGTILNNIRNSNGN